MDRLFILQNSFADDKYNPDGAVIRHLLNRYTVRNCDHYCIAGQYEGDLNEHFIPELDALNDEITEAKKKGLKPILVGSLEFVQEGFNLLYGNSLYMKPIEVPEPLWNETERFYRIMPGEEIPKDILQDSEHYFIKDADHLKKWNNLLIDGDCSRFVEDKTNYSVSERVEFLSEYRIFVYRGNIVAVQNYLGDPMVFPDVATIWKFKSKYDITCHHPASYTMDIGIMKDTPEYPITSIIEIHPFTSCGLYGFYDPCILNMFEDGQDWYLEGQFEDG